jgi:hypothetical protein
LIHQSITEVGEHELVAFVLRDWYFRNTVFNIKDLESEDAVILKDVLLRKFQKHLPGDVDVLVVPKGHADQSTAIQVKRLKVKVEADDVDYKKQMKGWRELFEEGVDQANQDAELGFWQSYLWVFVVIDTRIRNAGRLTYDGPDSLLRSQINSVMSTARLDPRVGFITFEFLQAMDKSPFAMDSSHMHQERGAKTAVQPDNLTRWLGTLKPKRYVAPSWTRKSSTILSW